MDIQELHLTEGAQRSCANAQGRGLRQLAGLSLVVFLSLPAAAQGRGEEAPVWLQPLVAEAQMLLDHSAPELRGEAALVLASSGMQRYHPAIIKVARDHHPEARIRGILALGILAAPGAEALLGEVLVAATTRVEPVSMAAALALGLLPEGHPAHAADEYLSRFRRSNYRRQRDVLASMLVGLSTGVRQSKATALRVLLEDAAINDGELRSLIVHVLLPVPDGLDDEEVEGLLNSTREEERRAVLRALLRSERKLPAEHLERVQRLAARDRSARVRAAALEYLTFHRHLSALELSARALDSRDPDEVAAAVHAAVSLGGGALATALEPRILKEESPEIQVAMLAAFGGRHSEEFQRGCTELAVDRSRPLAVRAHAAAIAAGMGDKTVASALRRMFLDAEDPEILALVTSALEQIAPGTPLVADIHPPDSPEDLERLHVRLRALVIAQHPEAFSLLRNTLRDRDVDPGTKADLLRAWRLGAWTLLDPEHTASLPEALAKLLR